MEITRLPEAHTTLVLSLSLRERLLLHTFIQDSWLHKQHTFPKLFKNFSGNPTDDSVSLSSMLQYLERKLRQDNA